MSLTTTVQVTIDLQTAAGLTRRGFGLPMLLSNEANSIAGFTQRARAYSSVAEITADGFSASGPTVAWATRMLGQQERPTQVIVGRRENLTDMSIVMSVIQVLATTNYLVTIGGAGTAAAFRVTSAASPTAITIAAQLVAAINAPAWVPLTAYAIGDHVVNGGNVYRATAAGTSAAAGGPTGTGSGIIDGTVTWTFVGTDQPVTATDNLDGTFDLNADVAGEIFDIVVDRSFITQNDQTTDPGVVADLTAVRTDITGNDQWYVLYNDNPTEAETLALATNVQTLERLFIAASADDDVLTAVSTDVGSLLNASSFTRTALMFHTTPHEFPHAAWAGGILPDDPGENTWKFQQLIGVSTDVFTTTEINNMKLKKVNRYVDIAGLGTTCDGTVASGEFIDVIRGADSIASGIREDVFAEMSRLNKIPFINDGLGIIETAIRGVLNNATPNVLSPDDPFTVTVPDVGDISTANKAARIAAPITFTGTLTGAVHEAQIAGTLTP